MGDQDIKPQLSGTQMQSFMEALLNDVKALEWMLNESMIESDMRRIGSEQEMFLVDENFSPAMIGPQMLESINDPRFTTELAKFNLEANLTPRTYADKCLSELEAEINEVLAIARKHAKIHGGDVALIGSLPTVQKSHLTLDAMTQKPRYHEINRTLTRYRDGNFELYIRGLDDLQMVHDNMMLEACNTSFQIHFQVSGHEFANLYNIAQLVTAPVLAAGTNSPLLLGRRLWHETRVALFKRSVDNLSSDPLHRTIRPRVHFGDSWVQESVLEIFRRDISRYRILLGDETQENSLEVLKNGGIPKLRALCLHNSCIWRWNRACYGISEGKPHLRIESRALPAGPTPLDQMANAAFFFGLMSYYSRKHSNIKNKMAFDDVKENFFMAARHGLNARFTWIDGQMHPAHDLILDHLLPYAQDGLKKAGIAVDDIERYLGVVEERVQKNRTGSIWTLMSYNNIDAKITTDLRCRVITDAYVHNQHSGKPVHKWRLAKIKKDMKWRYSYQTVGQFMTHELYTLSPDHPISLAANIMDWEKVDYMPVEDHENTFLGLVSKRKIFRLLTDDTPSNTPISQIMSTDIVTIHPDTGSVEAMELMKKHKVGCLPVVLESRLVGLITEDDFITIAGKLLEDTLREAE